METMQIGKDFIDFYQGEHTFYELGLDSINTANLESWCDHMSRKPWFVKQGFMADFLRALTSWVNYGDATIKPKAAPWQNTEQNLKQG